MEPIIYTIVISADTVQAAAEEITRRKITWEELTELMKVAKRLLERTEQNFYDDYRLEEEIQQWFDEAEYREKEEGNG